MLKHSATSRSLQAGILASSLLLTAGCNRTPAASETQQPATPPAATTPVPRSDQDVANDVQNKINGESALSGQNIQVSVNGGMVTLNGSVNNDAARALAGADSGGVNGVKTVVNNLTVAPARSAKTAPPESRAERRRHEERPAPPNQASAPPPPPQTAPPEQVRNVPPPPTAPPPPVSRTVSIDSGTSLPIRMTDSLDSATAQTGQVIHGVVAADIIAENMVAIPRGTPVTGRVVEAKDATHFSGSSLLTVELTQVELRGRTIPVSTTPFSQQGKGRGKNTAMKAGGGAALGAIIGAIAGGGKGAAIGAASGGGIGAGVNAVTRGEQVKIPAETLINFKLQSPVSVTTSRSASGSGARTFNEPNADPNQQQ